MFSDSSNEAYQLAACLNKVKDKESLAEAFELIEQYQAY